MYILPPRFRSIAAARTDRVTVGVTLALLALAACDSGKPSAGAGGRQAKANAASGCTAALDSVPIVLAVRDYIKSSTPKPMRLLSAAGTDSALPDNAVTEMQTHGPTYFYAGKDADKKKVRDRLELAGPYTALLVVLRGDTKNANGTEVVRLGGHYITGEFDGKPGDSRSYTFACDTAGWKISSRQDEKGS